MRFRVQPIMQSRWIFTIPVLVLLHCAKPSAQPGPLIQFRVVQDKAHRDVERVPYRDDTLYLDRHVAISDADLRSVQPAVREGGLLLQLGFTPEGAERLSQVTAQHFGRRLAFILNSQLCGEPPLIVDTLSAEVPVVAMCELSEDQIPVMLKAVQARWPTPAS